MARYGHDADLSVSLEGILAAGRLTAGPSTCSTLYAENGGNAVSPGVFSPKSACQAQSIPHLLQEEGVPEQYLIDALHALGPRYFLSSKGATCQIQVEGIDRPLWVHSEFLIPQSTFFEELLRPGNEPLNAGLIKIQVPHPETFCGILQYIYHGDREQWLKHFTPENFLSIFENVNYLGLAEDAVDVCLWYHKMLHMHASDSSDSHQSVQI